MATPTTSADPLVEALCRQLRVMDLVGWQRIAAWAEESDLSFEDLRLLLALARKMDAGPTAVSELAKVAADMAVAVLNDEEPETNDTTTYDNDVKVVPSYLLESTVVTKDNIKSVLIDSGYYTQEQVDKGQK